jgi:hypothetical protein
MEIYIHPISLYAPGGSIMTLAGFSDDRPVAGLLGREGFIEDFEITLEATAMRAE